MRYGTNLDNILIIIDMSQIYYLQTAVSDPASAQLIICLLHVVNYI